MATMALAGRVMSFTCPECNLPLQVPYTVSPGDIRGHRIEFDIQPDYSHVRAHIREHLRGVPDA